MSTIVPPLNIIPEIPAKVITKLIDSLNIQLEQLTANIQKMIADAVNLPEGCDCNDPRILALKDLLAKIQKQINDVQTLISKLNQITSTLSKITKVATTIKSVVAAGALMNPVTAPAFIAAQITMIQDATIVNALNSIKILKNIPSTLNATIAKLAGPLMDAVAKISMVCGNDDSNKLNVPKDIADAMNVTDVNGDFNGDFDYNELLPSEFYQDVNVSSFDLNDRADAIKEALERQQDLYTSILEAPSEVFTGEGIPDSNLGKIGDFYVDIKSNAIYGPKMSKTSWK
jgi:prefoldin subunit 5